MAIHLTGAISFQDLINEFSVPKPVSMSQMYAGGGYVPEANKGVPKSGAISLGNFYGATSSYVIDYTVTADMFNLDSATIIANSGWDGVTPLTLTINISTGIVLSSNNTGIPALTIQGDLPAESKVFINNNGYIIGMGGGGSGKNTGIGAGFPGGDAILTAAPTIINNKGTIGGGGGGGGSGTGVCGGGGGRTGRQESIAGTGNGTAAKNGTFAKAGTRGSMGSNYGGTGGDWGGTGAPSNIGNPSGAGGNAVKGNANVTWTTTGTVMGALID